MTKWLLIGGAAVAAYFLFLRKPAASPPPALPTDLAPVPQEVDPEMPPGMKGPGLYGRY